MTCCEPGEECSPARSVTVASQSLDQCSSCLPGQRFFGLVNDGDVGIDIKHEHVTLACHANGGALPSPTVRSPEELRSRRLVVRTNPQSPHQIDCRPKSRP